MRLRRAFETEEAREPRPPQDAAVTHHAVLQGLSASSPWWGMSIGVSAEHRTDARRADRSSAPSAVNGVTSAVMIPSIAFTSALLKLTRCISEFESDLASRDAYWPQRATVRTHVPRTHGSTCLVRH